MPADVSTTKCPFIGEEIVRPSAAQAPRRDRRPGAQFLHRLAPVEEKRLKTVDRLCPPQANLWLPMGGRRCGYPIVACVWCILASSSIDWSTFFFLPTKWRVKTLFQRHTICVQNSVHIGPGVHGSQDSAVFALCGAIPKSISRFEIAASPTWPWEY